MPVQHVELAFDFHRKAVNGVLVLIDRQAGLLFPDYQRRVMLQMHGTVEMFWDPQDEDGFTGGTGRFWEFSVERWIETGLSPALHAEFVDYSPFLPAAAPARKL